MARKQTESPKQPLPTDVGQLTESLYDQHFPYGKIDVLGDSVTIYVGLPTGYRDEIIWEQQDHLQGATMEERGRDRVYSGFSPGLADEMRLSRADAIVSWTWSPVA